MSYDIVRSTTLGGEAVIDAGNLVYHIASSYNTLSEYYQFLLECKSILESDPSKFVENERLNELLTIDYDPTPLAECLSLQEWLYNYFDTGSFRNCINCHWLLTKVVKSRSVLKPLVLSVAELYAIQDSSMSKVVYKDPNDTDIYRNIYRSPYEMTLQECSEYLAAVNASEDDVIIGLKPELIISLTNYHTTTCQDLLVADMDRILKIIEVSYDPYIVSKYNLYQLVNSLTAETWICEIVALIIAQVGPSESESEWLDMLDQIIDANQNMYQNTTSVRNVSWNDQIVRNQQFNVNTSNGRSMDNLWLIGTKILCSSKADDSIEDAIDKVIDKVDNIPDFNYPGLESDISDINTGVKDIGNNITNGQNDVGGSRDYIDTIISEINNNNSTYPNSSYDYKDMVIQISDSTNGHYNNYIDSQTDVMTKLQDLLSRMNLKYNSIEGFLSTNWQWIWFEITNFINILICAIKAIVCLILTILATIMDAIQRITKLITLAEKYKDISQNVANIYDYALNFMTNQVLDMLGLRLTSRLHIIEATRNVSSQLGEVKAAQFYATATAVMDEYWAQFDGDTIIAAIKAEIGSQVDDLVTAAKRYISSIYDVITGADCNSKSLIPDFDIFGKWRSGLGTGLRIRLPDLNIPFTSC